MKLFDSHAHLTDAAFAEDREQVLARAAEAGVDSVVCVASDLDDAEAALDLCRGTTRPRLRATAGIHPHNAQRLTDDSLTLLERIATGDSVVAIGETGLDFYYDNAPQSTQIRAFRAQLELAERIGKPVVVHAREADDPVAGLIRDFPVVKGVLHCFSGGPGLLEAGLAADWYVSFAGVVTFKNFRDADAVRRVPADRLLIETDSPYLAPVPRRGRRNEPAFVGHVAERLAELRGEEPEALAERTHQNACRFYRL